MSAYRFAPSPNFGYGEHSFATWTDAFSEAEIDSIRAYGDALPSSDGTLGAGDVIESIRKSKVSWVGHNQETDFIYDRLAGVARSLNGQFYGFDIWGFVEDFQYTIYNDCGGHYDWHVDRGVSSGNLPPRKLSLVLQLSDPSEYEGGELEVWTGQSPETVVKGKGLVAAFPSFTLHRVSPVTKGVRRTLVAWLAGERFR